MGWILLRPTQFSGSNVQSFLVSANDDWQNTGIYVHQDDSLTISYRSGTWTADVTKKNKVGPKGYPNEIEAWLAVETATLGALVGRIDIASENEFLIGTERHFDRANMEGYLWLRMNDSSCINPCLSDNVGAISVTIIAGE